jgi:hypothetical protein
MGRFSTFTEHRVENITANLLAELAADCTGGACHNRFDAALPSGTVTRALSCSRSFGILRRQFFQLSIGCEQGMCARELIAD